MSSAAARLAVPRTIDPAMFVGLDPDAAIVTLAGETMGTGWRVKLVSRAALDLAALESAIDALLDGLVSEMSQWEPASLLSRFNSAPAGSWIGLPPAFAEVIAAALDVAERSAGAFDPAVGALADLWGFGPAGAMSQPDDAAIDRALAAGDWRRLGWDPAARRLRQPGGLRLDLSGIAKGYAVDRLADLLAAHGVRHGLVEIGGEFAGRGIRPDGQPWWVELETPRAVAPPMQVALAGLAVATSGDYVRGRHTIDPRTGRPVDDMLAVSVIAGSAMRADAWATALGVLPSGEMRAQAEREGLAVRALVRTGSGIAEWISPALAAMLE